MWAASAAETLINCFGINKLGTLGSGPTSRTLCQKSFTVVKGILSSLLRSQGPECTSVCNLISHPNISDRIQFHKQLLGETTQEQETTTVIILLSLILCILVIVLTLNLYSITIHLTNTRRKRKRGQTRQELEPLQQN